MGMSKVKLYVSECYANGAGLYKRFKARAKGRCALLVVRSCFLHCRCQLRAIRLQRYQAVYMALSLPSKNVLLGVQQNFCVCAGATP